MRHREVISYLWNLISPDITFLFPKTEGNEKVLILNCEQQFKKKNTKEFDGRKCNMVFGLYQCWWNTEAVEQPKKTKKEGRMWKRVWGSVCCMHKNPILVNVWMWSKWNELLRVNWPLFVDSAQNSRSMRTSSTDSTPNEFLIEFSTYNLNVIVTRFPNYHRIYIYNNLTIEINLSFKGLKNG